jgi:putative phage-type endonuclease
MEAKIQKLIAE